jgi:pimeloyl-ACP methyl ester carboxylesterase
MFTLAKRLLALALLLGLLWYSSVCAYLWDTQREHIFEPSPVLQTTPDRVGLKYEEVRIPSGSGSERGELDAWWIPAEQADAPTLLFLHGSNMNISHVHDVATAKLLHGVGYNLLMVDYRGYGKSTGGEPSEAKTYEDAESAWNYLLTQRATKAQRTFIYGHSLGGAIAIELAVRHPEAAGVIAESTFTSMVDMGKRVYGYLPVDTFLNQRFDSIEKVSRLKVPVLFIHGTWDSLVPFEMSKELFDRAPQPKFLALIENGEHSDSSIIGWVEYRDALSSFVRKYAH